jgi:hypothetical protein
MWDGSGHGEGGLCNYLVDVLCSAQLCSAGLSALLSSARISFLIFLDFCNVLWVFCSDLPSLLCSALLCSALLCSPGFSHHAVCFFCIAQIFFFAPQPPLVIHGDAALFNRRLAEVQPFSCTLVHSKNYGKNYEDVLEPHTSLYCSSGFAALLCFALLGFLVVFFIALLHLEICFCWCLIICLFCGVLGLCFCFLLVRFKSY